MKRKIVVIGILSLCTLGVITAESQAFFGLFHCGLGCHNRCVTHITCRPYNAFTPICWGNLVCDGCCPNPCSVAGGGCCMPMGFGMPPYGGCGLPTAMAYGPGQSYASTSMVPPMPQGPPAPVQQMPDPRMAPFTPPAPMPVGPTAAMYPQYSPYGVSQAMYNPYYAPMYYPNYYTPNYYQPAPYYWYGYGR
jgi:hypothetical protein